MKKSEFAGWEVREPVDSEDQHVLPIDDLYDHDAEDCLCGPRTEAVPRKDGSYGWVVTHHSLDGRERYEEE